MIDIKRKEDCVGCKACVQVCPRKCIDTKEDGQGFLYPQVDVSRCIECGLCEKVCPVINQNDPRQPSAVFAGWNDNEKIRLSSSSGGIFYALAKRIIEEGGVVFGTRFNDRWEVIHAHAESLDGIKSFLGSKYVQSQIGGSYAEARQFLKTGHKVLFSGTPCQVAGLKSFLQKDYGEQLITVDVVCHGVPSPGIWREYLDYLTRPSDESKNTESQPYPISMGDIPSIEGISFRDKRLGWEKYGIAIRRTAPKGGRNSESQSAKHHRENESEIFESHRDNIFMQGFLKNLYLRPSCYECPAKCGKSHSDIILGDFWGLKHEYSELYSHQGVSLIMVNTENGDNLLKGLPISLKLVNYTDAISGNSPIEKSVSKPKTYDSFWQSYVMDGISAISNTVDGMRPSGLLLGLRKGLYSAKKIISNLLG